MVDRAKPVAESGDGGFVGEVDSLRVDPGLAGVRGGQRFLVAASGDDPRPGVQGGERRWPGRARCPAR